MNPVKKFKSENILQNTKSEKFGKILSQNYAFTSIDVEKIYEARSAEVINFFSLNVIHS
jgi:hypothetical protein